MANTGVQGATGYSESQIEAGQGGFTHVVNDVTVNTPGTVIDHEWISGCVAVNANNVTIKDSLIATQDQCSGGNQGAHAGAINDGNGSSPTGLLVEDTTVDGQNVNNSNGDNGVSDVNLTCLRCNVLGFTDDLALGANDTVQDSYVHSPTTGSCCVHEETTFADTADNINLQHDYFNADTSNGYIAGGVFIGDSYGNPGANAVTVNNSYVSAANQFALNMACGNTNIVITNDSLAPHNGGYGALSGGYAGAQFAWGSNGNTWSGNHASDTGATAPAPTATCS